MFKKEILLTLSVGAKRLQSSDSQLPSRSENYLFFLHLFVDWRSCKKSFEHFTGCRIYFFEFLTCVIKLVENHRCRVSFLYWINPAGRRNEFLLFFLSFFFSIRQYLYGEKVLWYKKIFLEREIGEKTKGLKRDAIFEVLWWEYYVSIGAI